MELPLELELAIQNAPDDRDGYSVAADWLQQAGSLQGELVALGLADRRDEPEFGGRGSRDRIVDRMIELEQKLLPLEVRTLSPASIEWRWGFVRGIQLVSIDDPDEARMLRDLLVSPIARFVQKLVVDRPSRALVDAILEAAEGRALRCLRTLMLFVGSDAPFAIDGDRLSRTLPSLRRLVLRRATVTGALALPRLFELGLHAVSDVARLLSRSMLPALDALMLTGDVDWLDDPNRWLFHDRLPALRSLTLTTPSIDGNAWLGARVALDLLQLDHVTMPRGRPTTRSFVVDRRPRSDDGTLVVMVGRGDLRPGTAIRIAPRPFTIGRSKRSALRLDEREVAMQHSEIYRLGDWRIRGEGVHLNGHYITDCALRSMDELAIGDHVFRFLEGDSVDALRERFAL